MADILAVTKKPGIEAPSWNLNFFVDWTLLLPTGGLAKKFSSIGSEMAEILAVKSLIHLHLYIPPSNHKGFMIKNV